jgi:Na+/melibiose symporter-like transporter
MTDAAASTSAPAATATHDAAPATGRTFAWWQLAAYALPGIPLAALLLPLYVTLPTYYAQDLGVGLTAVGAMLLLARLWDVVTDPLIGVLSDRTPGRLGRRKPWMLAGLPLAVVSVWLLFVPLAFVPEGSVGWAHLLLWTVLLYTGGTMVMLPYNAWAAEMTDDYHERSRVAAAREVAIVVGTVGAMAGPALLTLERTTIMAGFAWGLTILLPLGVLACVFALPDDAKARVAGTAHRFSWSVITGNRPFRKLIVAYFLNGIAYGLPATLFLLYVEHVLQAEEWAWPLLGVYFLCAVAGVPVWLRLSRRFGKHRVWMAAMGMAAATFWIAVLLGPGDIWWFLAVCILTGLPLGGELALPPSMQADVIDLDTLRSGRRRSGLFFAAWGVATKVPLALAVGIAFPALALAGFDAEAESQSGTALFALAALYALLPCVIKLLSIWLLRGYPIDAAEQERIKRRLAAGDDVAEAPGDAALLSQGAAGH